MRSGYSSFVPKAYQAASLRPPKASSHNSVSEDFNAAVAASRYWEELKDLTEEKVYQRLFPGRSEHENVFSQPGGATVHKELSNACTNLKLLHGEYTDQAKATGAAFRGYDRFCKSYQRYVLEHRATSRAAHRAGISIEVDRPDPTIALYHPDIGQGSTVYLFVTCLPFSRYAFDELCMDMKQDSWMLCHVAMFTPSVAASRESCVTT